MAYRDHDELDVEDAALVSMDVQRGYDDERWGERNNSDAERHVEELLAAWRAAGLPVVHVRLDATEPRSPLRRDRPGNEFKSEAAPEADEPVRSRNVGCPFAGTDLESLLRESGVRRPVFVGFTTDGTVSTAARAAASLGFDPCVVGDATVAFEREFDDTRYAAEQSHRLALAQLSGAYATILETATVLAGLES